MSSEFINRNPKISLFRKICFTAIFLFLMNGSALAHKVTVFAWVEGDTVFGESKFSGGRKAQGAEVIVWDMEGKELLRTQTDEEGDFSFPVPRKTGMRIELIAGMGHKGEWTIRPEEVGEIAPVSGDSADKTADAPAAELPPLQPETPNLSAPPADRAEMQSLIEKSVEKSLDRKLKPLLKMMADLQQKGPTVNDIVGGIGYIFGLMGVAMYFKSRQG